MTRNQRKWDRKRSILYLLVTDDENHEIGRLVDVSADGMLLVHQKPIEVNSQFYLSIHLPKKYEHLGPIRLQVKSHWTGADVAPEYSKSGLQFLDIDPRSLETLNRVVEQFSFDGGSILDAAPDKIEGN